MPGPCRFSWPTRIRQPRHSQDVNFITMSGGHAGPGEQKGSQSMNEPPRLSRVPRTDSGGPANPSWRLQPAVPAEPSEPGPEEAAEDQGGGGASPPFLRPTLSASGDSGPAAANLPDAVKISMWGSPNSGKTTYLAALDQATVR